MTGGSILVTSRLQAVVLRMVDFGGVTPADTGACPSVCRKDKVVEASISNTGACPAQHGRGQR
ncbi:hypothetical protein HanPI659440_Chr06g0246691 [Helianthus annuus]|nr:hypothetical protein HanPI659440_Chr06g0246691 [Helianthus annuus]